MLQSSALRTRNDYANGQLPRRALHSRDEDLHRLQHGHEAGSVHQERLRLPTRLHEGAVHRYALRTARMHLPSAGTSQRLPALRAGLPTLRARRVRTLRARVQLK